MIKYLGLGLGLWLCLGSLGAQVPVSEADRAFTEGRYDDAIKLWSALLPEHAHSADLYFNLANAELKAGRLAPALLDYERARYFAPTDRDIETNLQLARKQAGLPPDTFKWWQVLVLRLPLNFWYGLLDGGILLLIGAFLLHLWRSFFIDSIHIPPRVLTLTVRSIFFFATPLVLLLIFFSVCATALDLRQQTEGVIMVRQAVLRISPFIGAEQLDSLPEGERVTIDAKHSDYFLARARDKHFGWVKASDIQPIVPGAF